MPIDFRIIEKPPTATEYRRLRRLVGWPDVDRSTADKALRKSIFSVCALYEEGVVGFGRVIGDGALYFYIQDVIVHPAFQRRGVGSLIMESILSFLDSQKKSGSFAGLMTSRGLANFYGKFGFQSRPLDKPGMFLVSKE